MDTPPPLYRRRGRRPILVRIAPLAVIAPIGEDDRLDRCATRIEHPIHPDPSVLIELHHRPG